MDLSGFRREYKKGEIDMLLPVAPMQWFAEWLQEAVSSGETEANAMVLSTVSAEGRPAARVVLLKSVDKQGFVFFTNYQSRKGQHLTGNAYAALTFFWQITERQVRIEGKVEKVSPLESDEYFNSRPLESRIGAMVSPQSREIASREVLEAAYADELEKAKNIQRPQHWGGYRLLPDLIEFWQGRPGRLHNRIQYTRENATWRMVRLSP